MGTREMTRKAFLAWRVILVHGKFDFGVKQIIWARDTLQTWKSRASHYRIQRNLAWTSLNTLSIGGLHRSFNAIGLGGTNDRFKVGMLTRKCDFRRKHVVFVEKMCFSSIIIVRIALRLSPSYSPWKKLQNGTVIYEKDEFSTEFGPKVGPRHVLRQNFGFWMKKCEMISDLRGSFR